jgi:hypothetical protein
VKSENREIGFVACRAGDGCGGPTGITPLLNYRAWIIDTAKRLRATVAP